MYAEGYKYWLAYKKANTKYYRCRRYKSNCAGRCVVENGQIRSTTPHNHAAEPDRALVDKFRKVLTQRAQKERTELYTIYWEEATQRHSDAAMIYSFTQAESCMRKARRKQPPQSCTTIRELSEILGSSSMFYISCGNDKENLFKTTIMLEDATCLIFMHNKTIQKLGKVEEIHVDHSIKSEPAPPNFNYSILTIHAVQQQQSYPLVYVVMTVKSYSIYSAIFAYLREQIPETLSPTNIFSNYDTDMMSALSMTFPEASVRGYYFHFTSAVLHRMRLLKMLKQNKGHTNNAIKMLLVLPLLPANYIRNGLQSIRKWLIEKKINTPQFENLCDFIEQQWLMRIGAEKISIFSMSHCVSNSIETFNEELQNTLGIQNPVIWHMLESITHIARQTFTKVTKRSKQLLPVSKLPRLKGQLIQNTIIQSATQLWIKTAVHLRNPLQFLQVTSHCINDSLFAGVEVVEKSDSDKVLNIGSTFSNLACNSNSESSSELPGLTYTIVNSDDLQATLAELPQISASSNTFRLQTIQSPNTTNTIYQQTTPVDVQQSQNQNLIIPTSDNSITSTDPPPLAFYPKAFLRGNIIKRSEPPPLIFYKDMVTSTDTNSS
uniref:CSON005571 protein n=1 Tax=Culicoides sonorensis TaxID=179676 RepID=A0A336LYY7_CULSO